MKQFDVKQSRFQKERGSVSLSITRIINAGNTTSSTVEIDIEDLPKLIKTLKEAENDFPPEKDKQRSEVGSEEWVK